MRCPQHIWGTSKSASGRHTGYTGTGEGFEHNSDRRSTYRQNFELPKYSYYLDYMLHVVCVMTGPCKFVYQRMWPVQRFLSLLGRHTYRRTPSRDVLCSLNPRIRSKPTFSSKNFLAAKRRGRVHESGCMYVIHGSY